MSRTGAGVGISTGVKRIKRIARLATSVALLHAGAAAAHHTAGFDSEQPVEITGRVTRVEWANPHVWFYVETETAAGESREWAFEMASPNALLRRGWRPDSLEAGTVITVVGSRAHDGSLRASARSVTLPNGDRLFSGRNDSR